MSKIVDLLNLLVEKNLLDAPQIENILAEVKNEKKSIDEILLKNKIINSEKLAEIKAQLYFLPYANLAEKEIDEGVLNTISSEVAENYQIVCFDRSIRSIKVGLTQPDNFKAIEAVDFLAKGNGLSVEYYFISRESFESAFKQYKSLAKELSSALKTHAEEEESEIDASEKDKADVSEVTRSAPVAKIVSVIIRHAVEGGASDIHIEPSRKETRVRYRIDGILHTSLILPRSVHQSIVARVKVMANLKLDETRVPQDGRIRLIIADKEIDFRVSILPLVGTEKVVMRILDTTKGAPKLSDLGYQGQQLKVIMENLKKTEGLLLATGPTGSGKSTTLFSVLSLLNKEGVNISTLEDPVEYQMKGVNQSQIRPEIGYTFSSGLRSFLRQDPDIIMVGEIRDGETAELAIHAALTGHYVVSTLHTTDAAGAISRFIDMGIAPFLLGSTLHTVIAQRLTRKICEFCKEPFKIPDEFQKEVEKEIETMGEDYIRELIPDYDNQYFSFYHGIGCPKCGNTGYSGRVAVAEVLDVNSALKEKILNGQNHLSLEEIRQSQKYVTIKEDGIIKMLQGKTTLEEVLRVMKD
jgi:type IV pilus assembly protein PilB